MMMMMMMMMVMMMLMIANCVFREFFRFTRDTLALHKFAFSCLASLRTIFFGTSFPHTLANALSVEELNRAGFYNRSDAVCFLIFCRLQGI